MNVHLKHFSMHHIKLAKYVFLKHGTQIQLKKKESRT